MQRKANRLRTLTIVTALFARVQSRAEEPDALGSRSVFSLPRASATNVVARVASPTRRIIVTGDNVEENAQLAWSAEEALQRIEQLIGAPVPFTRMDPIRIVLKRNLAVSSGEMLCASGWVDLQLIQRITITNPELVDQEDLLESLCRFALARYVIFAQSGEQRQKELGAVPDWLAVGVAQNLYAGLRERNARIMLREWRNGRHFSWAEVLELDRMPDGRWGEKAAAGLAMGLLASQPERVELFRKLLGCMVVTRTVTPALFSQLDPAKRSPLMWEKEWDVWMASQEKIIRLRGSDSPAKWEALKRELSIRPLDLGLAEQHGMPAELAPEDLIRFRYETWAAPLATLVAFRIRAGGIGQSQTFWAVSDAYADFFEAVAACRTHGWWRRKVRGGAVQRTLKRQWEHAKEMHERALKEVGLESEEETGQTLSVDETGMQRFLPRAERLRRMDQMRLQRQASLRPEASTVE